VDDVSSAFIHMLQDEPRKYESNAPMTYEEELRIALWSSTPPQMSLGALQCTQKHPEKSQR
jgi:hypothetical protein